MKCVTAGTLESNDIFIAISRTPPGKDTPGAPGENTIRLESIVLRQFGPDILATIEKSLALFKVTGVTVEARDKGALDCTIAARMEAAILRYKELMQC